MAQGGQWLHVDMAGPAWMDDRGTGYGVALLSELVDALQNSSGLAVEAIAFNYSN